MQAPGLRTISCNAGIILLLLLYQILSADYTFAVSETPIPVALLRARPAGAPSIGMPAHEDIRNAIQTKGTSRVIVRLAPPASLPGGFRLDAGLEHAESVNQRSAIRGRQDTVLSRISMKRAAASKKFEFIPFMALEVDQADLESLIASPEVDFIEEDIAVPPHLAQSVPLIGGINGAFDGYTGSGQVVAILDTGVKKTHPFLTGRVLSEACYSTDDSSSNAYCVSGSTASDSGLPCSDLATGCWHGTHVAGIAAGRNGPSYAPSGVAKDAGVIAVQVFSQFSGIDACGSEAATCPQAWNSDLLSGLQRIYALRSSFSIASVNMSLGGGQYSSYCDSAYPSFKTAVDNLRSAGIATVISSGNNSYTNSIGFPACISSAVSVGATTESDVAASYSNSASFLNMLAPGSSITSSYPNTGYATANGTSMAAPHVAGAWALIKSAKPTATVPEVLNALIATGIPITDSRNGITKPRIEVVDALHALVPRLTVNKSGSGSGSVSSNPSGIVCGAACYADFSKDSSVTLTATPDAGSSFSGWSGACTGAGACQVGMDSSKSVTAAFSLIPVDGVCGSANGQTFISAPTANLCWSGTASAVTGAGPWNWSCEGLHGGSSDSCSANITSFAMSASVYNGIGGDISPSAAAVPYGGNVTFIITPDTGYTLGAITDNEVGVTALYDPSGFYTYTLDNVTANHNITATFTAAASVPALPFRGVLLAAGFIVLLAARWNNRHAPRLIADESENRNSTIE